MLTNNTKLDNNTAPCPNKATNSLFLDSSSNTDHMDVKCKTQFELNNLIKSGHLLSKTQENLAANEKTAQATESNDITQES